MVLPKTQKLIWLLALLCSFGHLSATSRAAAEELADEIMEVTDSLVKARLGVLGTHMMEFRHDKIVRRRIVNYVENWPVATGRMLARSARYFPIFEAQLAANNMPLELKYVAIQESALRPYATSRVGAGGLWQLMPGTARELGLRVDGTIDQRLDPELGCAAGLQYLRYQYERYGDWALAIAAYNCGPGNVNKAIRRSGKREPNYWQIRKHLPRETANYLPSIIAAVYIMTYYHDHDVAPGPMELDMQMTEAITVRRELSLHRVIQVTGLRAENVIELNPQYLQGYLPASPAGNRLRLPARVMPAMRTYLNTHPATAQECDIDLPWASPRLHEPDLAPDRHYVQYRSVASARDTSLRQLAAQYQIPADQLAVWSNLGVLDSLREHDEIFFYRVQDYRPYDPRDRHTPPAAALVAGPEISPLRVPRRKFRGEAAPLPVTEKAGISSFIRGWFN